MAVIRRRRTDNFTIIPNDVLNDETLSFEAIGMHCYLLSKPDDWCVSIDDLRRAGRCGRDRIYRILNELMTARKIDRVMHRNGAGQVDSIEYVVFNEAVGQGRPLPENSDTVKPETENTDALIRTESHQELTIGTRGHERACRLPADFEPNSEWAIEQGLSPAEVARERDRFRDHWAAAPGQRGVKRDWDATWRNWVRAAIDRLPPHRRSQGRQRQPDPLFAFCETVLSASIVGDGNVIEHQR